MDLPLDVELQAALSTMDVRTPYNMEDLLIQRERTDHLCADDILANFVGITHEQYTISGPRGNITVSVFRNEAKATSNNLGIFYVHPGGMILGNRFLDCATALEWVQHFGAVCVTAEYRLAPENPHPAPTEDCYTALQWMAQNATELDFDSALLMIVGISGGGGIAAALTLLCRQNGPSIAAQVLICPMLDPSNNTISAQQKVPPGIWDRASNSFGWNCILGDNRQKDKISILAAPWQATTADLHGLPPTFIDVGESEIFRDECVAYASKLWAAGVSTELHVWPGAFHGFDLNIPKAAISRTAKTTRSAWVYRWLRRSQTSTELIS
jgi:acetyl esterase/lipase